MRLFWEEVIGICVYFGKRPLEYASILGRGHWNMRLFWEEAIGICVEALLTPQGRRRRMEPHEHVVCVDGVAPARAHRTPRCVHGCVLCAWLSCV